MTEQLHQEALNCLIDINILKIESTVVSKENNLVKVNYKHQVIDLGSYCLILSGTLEQFRTEKYSRDRMFY